MAGVNKVELGVVVSANNSTGTPLGAGGTFTGIADDLLGFEEIDINLFGLPDPAPGTLLFEFSPDGVNWDVAVPYVLPSPNIPPQPLRVVLRYFRVSYVNGATPQTAFRLTVVYHRTGAKHLTRFLNQEINDTEPIEIVRAILSGARPDGFYGNVPVTRNNHLGISIADVGPLAETRLIGADKAVFGAAVVGSRLSRVLARWNQGLASNDVSIATTGTGTVNTAASQLIVSSGVGASASAAAFSNKVVKYLPARETYGMFTAAFTLPTSASSNQRAALLSAAALDGFFVGYQGLVFGVTVRSNGVDTFIPQTAFDDDPLDGGPNSRFTRVGVAEALDPTNKNAYRIRYGWLGSAPVFFEIMAPDGQWVTFHTIRQPNVSPLPSILEPNLGIRFEVDKTVADATDLIIRSGSWDAGIVDVAGPGVGPEDVQGNNYVTANLSAVSADATLYTVSPGRVLKVTSMTIFVNNAVAILGNLRIKDGGIGGPTLLPVTVRGPGNVDIAATFPVPLRFSTDVFCDIVAGTLTYSIGLVGYESEP